MWYEIKPFKKTLEYQTLSFRNQSASVTELLNIVGNTWQNGVYTCEETFDIEGTYTIPKTWDGIYDITVRNLTNVTAIRLLSNDQCIFERTHFPNTQKTLDNSVPFFRIPLAFPTEPSHIYIEQTSGCLEASFIPIITNYEKLAIQLNEGASGTLVVGKVVLGYNMRTQFALQPSKFFIDGKPFTCKSGYYKSLHH